MIKNAMTLHKIIMQNTNEYFTMYFILTISLDFSLQNNHIRHHDFVEQPIMYTTKQRKMFCFGVEVFDTSVIIFYFFFMLE